MNDDRFPTAPGFKEQGGTSEDAAKLMAGTAPALRQRCFGVIEASAIGRTADEVAEALDWELCSIRARISELHAMGWVKKDGRRANNRSRASTVVWKAVGKRTRIRGGARPGGSIEAGTGSLSASRSGLADEGAGGIRDRTAP